jgi:hypothetical protein
MNQNIIFIDFENIPELPEFNSPDIFKIIILVGSDQHKISFETVQKSQVFGNKVEWIKVNERGKNALDFFITYYLGFYVSRHPKKIFSIYTNDRGVDPLINHLQQNNINVKRLP